MATTQPTTAQTKVASTPVQGPQPLSTPQLNVMSMTTPGGGYVSSDPNIRAQVLAMSNPGTIQNVGGVSALTTVPGAPVAPTPQPGGVTYNKTTGYGYNPPALPQTNNPPQVQATNVQYGRTADGGYIQPDGSVKSTPPALGYTGNSFIDSRLGSTSAKEGASGVASSDQARQQADQLQQSNMGLGSDLGQFFKSLSDKLEARSKQDQDLLVQQQDAAKRATLNAQEEETKSQAALQYRLGRTGTTYGESEMNRLNAQHRSELADLQVKYAGLMQQSQRALEDGQISLAKEFRAAAVQSAQLAIQQDQAYMQKRQTLLQIQKYERDDASATFTQMAKAGFVPDPDYLQSIDKKNGWDIGTSEIMYRATASDQEKADTKSYLETQKLIFDTLDKLPLGTKTTINGKDYYSTNTGKIEIDENGIGTSVTIDPQTGEFKVTSLGKIGKSTGWTTKTDDQDRLWSINPSTGEMKLFTPTFAQSNIQSIIPDGSVWKRNGQPAPECGQFVNDLTGAGVGDSFESKMSIVDKTIKPGSDNPPRVGDVFVQNLNSQTGHVGIVAGVSVGPDGKTYITALESNYPNSGKISSSRVIESSAINGFGRTGKNSPMLNQLLGGTDFAAPTFSGIKDKVLSAQELMSRGLDPEKNHGMTQKQADAYIKTQSNAPTALDMTFEEFKKQEENRVMMSLPDESVKKEYDIQRNTLEAIKSVANKQKSTGQRLQLKQDLMQLYHQGDEEGLKQRIETEGYNLMTPAQQTTYTNNSTTADTMDNASKMLELGKVGTGPYKAIYQLNAPWANIKRDEEYADLKSRVNSAQATYTHELYGGNFTANEMQRGGKFLVEDKDSPEIISLKLRNMAALMRFNNDVAMSYKLGIPRPKIDDYLPLEK